MGLNIKERPYELNSGRGLGLITLNRISFESFTNTDIDDYLTSVFGILGSSYLSRHILCRYLVKHYINRYSLSLSDLGTSSFGIMEPARKKKNQRKSKLLFENVNKINKID